MAAVTNSAAASLLGSYQSVARAFVASANLGTDTFSGQVFHGLGVSPDTILATVRSTAHASFPVSQLTLLSWDATVAVFGLNGAVGNGGVVADLYFRREHSIVR